LPKRLKCIPPSSWRASPRSLPSIIRRPGL
jgi:hypothetical protein